MSPPDLGHSILVSIVAMTAWSGVIFCGGNAAYHLSRPCRAERKPGLSYAILTALLAVVATGFTGWLGGLV